MNIFKIKSYLKEIESLKLDIIYLKSKNKQLENDKKQLQIDYCKALDDINRQQIFIDRLTYWLVIVCIFTIGILIKMYL